MATPDNVTKMETPDINGNSDKWEWSKQEPGEDGRQHMQQNRVIHGNSKRTMVTNDNEENMETAIQKQTGRQ